MRIWTFGLLVVMCLMFTSGVLASTITRTFPNPIIQCTSVNVSLNVDVTGSDTFYIIDEMFPAGWNVTNPGSGSALDPGHIKWAVISGAVDTQYTYTIKAPCTIGNYNFTGVYGFDDMAIRTILPSEVKVFPLCQTTADTSANGIIELSEIMAYVNDWFNGRISRDNLLQALNYWKAGSGC